MIAARCERGGLKVRPRVDFEVVNPENDPRYRDYWGSYHQLMARRGVTPDLARAIMRTNTTAIGAIMVHRGEADSLICGTFGQYMWHLKCVVQVLGGGAYQPIGALSLMILEDGPLFIADTQVHPEPTPPQIAETARRLRAPCTPVRAGTQDCTLFPFAIRQPRLRYRPTNARGPRASGFRPARFRL